MSTPMSPRWLGRWRVMLWLLALGAQLGVLLAAGGALPGPGRVDPASVTAWLDERGPLVAAMASARLFSLACCAYLLVTVCLGLLARLTQVPTLVAAADLITIPWVRRLLHGSVGVGLALAASTATAGASPAPSPVVMRLLDHHPAEAGQTADPIRSAPPVMRALGEHSSAEQDGRSSRPEAPGAADAGSHVAPQVSATGPGSWTVSAGEHLWGIAHRTLEEAWSRPPTDAETAAYLGSLVARNQDRLVVPANPDLILPGQVFELPPVPPPLTGA